MKVNEIINKINQIDKAKRYIDDWLDGRAERLISADISTLDDVTGFLEDLKIILLNKDVN